MTHQNSDPIRDSTANGRGLKQAGKLVGLIVGALILIGVALVAAIFLLINWQTEPRSSVGIDSPEIARPKLQAIEDRLSVELTGADGNLINNRFDNDGEPDPEEAFPCKGPDGAGSRNNFRRKLDGAATENDYATVVDVMESLPGWSSAPVDSEPIEGRSRTAFTHEEIGGIVVSLQQKASPPELAFWMTSYCYRE